MFVFHFLKIFLFRLCFSVVVVVFFVVQPTGSVVGVNRLIDSDGVLRDVSSDAVTLTTADYGSVDLSFDFGFVLCFE